MTQRVKWIVTPLLVVAFLGLYSAALFWSHETAFLEQRSLREGFSRYQSHDYSGAISKLEKSEFTTEEWEALRNAVLGNSFFHQSESLTGSELTLKLEAAHERYKVSLEAKEDPKVRWNLEFIEKLQGTKTPPESQKNSQKGDSSGSGSENPENSENSGSGSQNGSNTGSGDTQSGSNQADSLSGSAQADSTKNEALSGSTQTGSNQALSGSVSSIRFSNGASFSGAINSTLSENEKQMLENALKSISEDQSERGNYLRDSATKNSSDTEWASTLRKFFNEHPIFGNILGDQDSNNSNKKDW